MYEFAVAVAGEFEFGFGFEFAGGRGEVSGGSAKLFRFDPERLGMNLSLYRFFLLHDEGEEEELGLPSEGSNPNFD